MRLDYISLPHVAASSIQRQLLSLRGAARWLGIDRGRLGSYVAAGCVRHVLLGRSPRISMSELERIAREGLPELDTLGKVRRARRKAATTELSEAEVREKLAEF